MPIFHRTSTEQGEPNDDHSMPTHTIPSWFSPRNLLIGAAIGVTFGLPLGFVCQSMLQYAHDTTHQAKNEKLPEFPASKTANELPPMKSSGQQFTEQDLFQQMAPNTTMTTTISGYPIYTTGGHAVDYQMPEGFPAPDPTHVIDRNGLVGNPCMDPPSTYGRAYRTPGTAQRANVD